MSQDDLHLCEGLLNIFIKPDTDRQVITYKKSRIERSSYQSSAKLRDAVLDFGSYKETIYIGSSSSTSQTPSEFEAVCDNRDAYDKCNKLRSESSYSGSIQVDIQPCCVRNFHQAVQQK